MVRFLACSFYFIFGVPFVHLFLFGAVLFHNRVPLGPDIPGIILLYDVFIPCMYLYRAAAAAVLLLLCVVILLLLLHQLLLFVIVCRMAKIVAGSLNCFLSLYSQTYIIFNACTPWQCCRIYGLDLRILHPR